MRTKAVNKYLQQTKKLITRRRALQLARLKKIVSYYSPRGCICKRDLSSLKLMNHDGWTELVKSHLLKAQCTVEKRGRKNLEKLILMS